MANIKSLYSGLLRIIIISYKIQNDTWKIARNFPILTYVNLCFFAQCIPFLTII